MHFFHKWEYFNRVINDTFLGEPIQVESKEFRRCTVCHRAQEFNWDSQGGSWRWLNSQKLVIFNKKYPLT